MATSIIKQDEKQCWKFYNHTQRTYNENSYLNFETISFSSNDNVFVSQGLINFKNSGKYLISISVGGQGTSGRAYWSLVNYNTTNEVARIVEYGSYVVSTYTTILNVADNDVYGIKFFEAFNLNQGLTNSTMLSIIKL